MLDINNFGLRIFAVCDKLSNLLPDILMTGALFLGGLGLDPNKPIIGSKPTIYQEILNPLFIKHATGFEWKRRKNI